MTQECKQCGEILPDGIEYGIAHLEKKHKQKVTSVALIPKTND